jgi:hypothetical protein
MPTRTSSAPDPLREGEASIVEDAQLEPRLDGDTGQPGTDGEDGELEPWDLPPAPPRPAVLREQSVEEVLSGLRRLDLPRAREFIEAYRSIPASELEPDGFGWAGFGDAADARSPTLEHVWSSRARLRDRALGEAGRGGFRGDPDPSLATARSAVVEALSHASLRGGQIEEATLAAETAAQDATLALLLRDWIPVETFEQLVAPWVRAGTEATASAEPFDILGLGVLALAVFALFDLTASQGNLASLTFGLVATLLAVALAWLRWRLRRRPAA